MLNHDHLLKEYVATFATEEEAMKFGEEIHTMLRGDKRYIDSNIVLNCTDTPGVVTLSLFEDPTKENVNDWFTDDLIVNVIKKFDDVSNNSQKKKLNASADEDDFLERLHTFCTMTEDEKTLLFNRMPNLYQAIVNITNQNMYAFIKVIVTTSDMSASAATNKALCAIQPVYQKCLEAQLGHHTCAFTNHIRDFDTSAYTVRDAIGEVYGKMCTKLSSYASHKYDAYVATSFNDEEDKVYSFLCIGVHLNLCNVNATFTDANLTERVYQWNAKLEANRCIQFDWYCRRYAGPRDLYAKFRQYMRSNFIYAPSGEIPYPIMDMGRQERLALIRAVCRIVQEYNFSIILADSYGYDCGAIDVLTKSEDINGDGRRLEVDPETYVRAQNMLMHNTPIVIINGDIGMMGEGGSSGKHKILVVNCSADTTENLIMTLTEFSEMKETLSERLNEEFSVLRSRGVIEYTLAGMFYESDTFWSYEKSVKDENDLYGEVVSYNSPEEVDGLTEYVYNMLHERYKRDPAMK